jgi:polyferredoxin
MARIDAAAHVADAAVGARGRTRVHDLLLAAITGGLLAGAAMMAWMAAGAALGELSPSHPLEVASAAFTGRDPVGAGPGGLVSGALLWALVSVALALLYAQIVPRDFPFAPAALVGAGYSWFVMALMTSVVLPWVNPLMRAAMAELGGTWVFGYAVFGILLGFIPVFRRRVFAR